MLSDTAESQSVESQRSFVLKPNPAMGWRNLLLLYGLMSAITLSIGVLLYFRGFSLVLPFSGLDVIALGIALYVTARRSEIREVVTISKGKIAVETGHKKPEEKHEFEGSRARIILEAQKGSWYPSQLFIRSGNDQVEIGKFLNEDERVELASELKKAISCFV